MKHKQLTLKERYHISLYLESGWTQKAIAEKIGVHPSTISREIRRSRDSYLGKYDVGTVRTKTKERHKRKPKYTVITDKVEHYIRQKLKEQWSPEQIAGRCVLISNRQSLMKPSTGLSMPIKQEAVGSTSIYAIRTKSIIIETIPIKKEGSSKTAR